MTMKLTILCVILYLLVSATKQDDGHQQDNKAGSSGSAAVTPPSKLAANLLGTPSSRPEYGFYTPREAAPEMTPGSSLEASHLANNEQVIFSSTVHYETQVKNIPITLDKAEHGKYDLMPGTQLQVPFINLKRIRPVIAHSLTTVKSPSWHNGSVSPPISHYITKSTMKDHLIPSSATTIKSFLQVLDHSEYQSSTITSGQKSVTSGNPLSGEKRIIMSTIVPFVDRFKLQHKQKSKDASRELLLGNSTENLSHSNIELPKQEQLVQPEENLRQAVGGSYKPWLGIHTLISNVSSYSSKQNFHDYSLSWKSVDHNVTNKENFTTEILGKQEDYAKLRSTVGTPSKTLLAINHNNSVDNDNNEQLLSTHDMSKAFVALVSSSHPTEEALFFDGDSEYAPTPLALPLLGLETSWSNSKRAEYVRRSVESPPPNGLSSTKSIHENLVFEGNQPKVSSHKKTDNYVYFSEGDLNEEVVQSNTLLSEKHIGGYDSGYATNITNVLNFEKAHETSERHEDVIKESHSAQMLISYNGSSSVSEVPFQKDVNGSVGRFDTGNLERANDGVDGLRPDVANQFGTSAEHNDTDKIGEFGEIESRKMNAAGRNVASTSPTYYNYRGGVKDEQQVVGTDKFGHSVLVKSLVQPGTVERKSSESGNNATEYVNARGMSSGGRSEPSSLLEVEHMCRACSQVCHHTTAEVGSAGRVRCGCFRGYAIASDWQHCADVDECVVKESICQNGMCLNTLGSFTCLCRPGYEQLGSDCVDIDECAIGAACDQLCINLPGSYQCWCRRGFTLSTVNRRLCVDLDECSLGLSLCAGQCLNTFGSFVCRCPPGATLHTDGRTCIVRALESGEHSPHIVLHRGTTVQPSGEHKVLDFPTAHTGGSGHSALEKRKLHLETLHNVATLRSSMPWLKQNRRPTKPKPPQQTSTRRPSPEDLAHDRAIHDERGGAGSEAVSLNPSPDDTSPVWHNYARGRGHLYTENSAEKSVSRSSKNEETGNFVISSNVNVDMSHFTEIPRPLEGMKTKSDRETEAPEIFHGNRFLSRLETKLLLTTELPFRGFDPTTSQISETRLPKYGRQPQDQLHWSSEMSVSTSNPSPGSYSRRDRQRRTCVPPCRNGGVCNTAAGVCACLAGFRGRYCQLDRNECTDGENPCGGHLCVNAWGSYRCLCPAGYRSVAGGTSCVRENAWRDLRVGNMVVEDWQITPPVLSSAENLTTAQHFSFTAESEKSGTEVTTVIPKMGSRQLLTGDSVKNGSVSSPNSEDGNISGSNLKIRGSYPDVLIDTSQYSSLSPEMPTGRFALGNFGSRVTTFATTPAVSKESVTSNPPRSSSRAKEPAGTTPAYFSQNVIYTLAVAPKLYGHRFSNVSSLGAIRDLKIPAESVREYIPEKYVQPTESITNVDNLVPLMNSVSNKTSENSDASTQREHLTASNLSGSGVKVNFSQLARNNNSATSSDVHNLSSYEPILVIGDGRHLNVSLSETEFESKKNKSLNKTTIQSDKSGERSLTEKDFLHSEHKTTILSGGDNDERISDSWTVSSATKKTLLLANSISADDSEKDRLRTAQLSADSEAQNLSKLPTVTQKMTLLTEEQDTPELKMKAQEVQRPEEKNLKTIKSKKVRSSMERNSQEERREELSRQRVAASRPPGSRMFLLEPLPSPTPTTVGTPPLLPTVGTPPQPGADCFFKYRRIPSGQSFYKDATNCTICVCRDSEVRCERRQCPVEPLQCEQPVSGRCCQRCPHDCELASGDVLRPGEAWASPLDLCRVCRCGPNGQMECRPVECTAQCYHPRLAPSECCPVCKGCQYGSHTYDDGQLFPHPAQPCTTCVCQQGNITCYPEACAPAGCSHPLAARPYSCCPRCLHCLLEGQRLLHGASLLLLAGDATCRNCSCRYGNVSCSLTACEATSGCRLESGAVVAPGSQFWPAQDACTACRCGEDGHAQCRSADCPGPPCTHGVLLPDSCCLDCSKCDYRGELFEENQEFILKTDRCQSCTCSGGNVTCHNICSNSSAVRLPGD